MNDGSSNPWHVIWSMALVVTIGGLCAVSSEKEPQPAAVGGLFVLLCGEFFLMALPAIWDGWKRNAPRREQARAVARERAAERARLRQEREEIRRRKSDERSARYQAKVGEARARRSTADARREAETYYRANAELLADVLPPSLFRSEVEAGFPSGISPTDAWQTARDLIGRMQPLVLRERERLRKEGEALAKRAEEVAELDAAIRAHEGRMKKLRGSSLDPGIVDDEIAGLKQKVEQLHERRASLRRTT